MDRAFRISVVATAFMLSAAAMALGIWLSATSEFLALLPLLLFIGLVAAYGVVTAATEGARWAIAAFVVCAVLIMSASLRTGDAPKGFDLQSIVKFATYCVAFFIGALGVRYSSPRLLTPTGLFLMLYAAWAAVTTVFSPIPEYTVAAAFGIMAWALLAAAACARFTARQMLLIVLSALSLFIIISWPIYLFAPTLGKMYFGAPGAGFVRFTGLAGTPNDAAQLAVAYLATLAAFHLSRFRFNPNHRTWAWLYFGGTAVLAFGVLVLSDSRGALIAFVAVCLSIVVQKTRSALYAVLAGLIFLFVLFAVPNPVALFHGVLALLSRSGNVQDLFNLTGRVDIWSAVMSQIMQAPLIGAGYASSREIIPEIWANRWGQSVGSAHNFFLQSMLEVGLIGTILLILVFVASAVRYFLRPNYFRDSIFVLVFVTGLVEAGVTNSANVLILIWFISLFYEESRERVLAYDYYAGVAGRRPHLRPAPRLEPSGQN